MKKNWGIILGGLLLGLLPMQGQQNLAIPGLEAPTHNLLKYGDFWNNPAFGQVRKTETYFQLYHRNQSFGFQDNYEAYIASYSASLNQQTALGGSVSHQREGLIDNNTIILNLVRAIRLSDDARLALGVNAGFRQRALSTGRRITSVPDPFLDQFENQSELLLSPGLVFSSGRWDFGFTAYNLVRYSLQTELDTEPLSAEAFGGQVRYFKPINSSSAFFDEGRWMFYAQAISPTEGDAQISGSVLLDLPSKGWLQAGYNTEFGGSAGFGLHLSGSLSLSYLFEQPLAGDRMNLGTTHEIGLTYAVGSKNIDKIREKKPKKQRDPKPKKKKTKKSRSTKKAGNSDLDSLKTQLAETNALLSELLKRQDSLEKRNEQLEDRMDELLALLKSGNGGILPSNIKEIVQRSDEDDETGLRVDKLNINGNKIGFYLVLETFGSKLEVDAAQRRYDRMGVQTGHFYNDDNDLYYVYWKRFDSRRKALQALRIIKNSDYQDKAWIVQMENN